MTSDRVSNDHMSPVAPHALAQSVAELQIFLTEQDGVVTNITNEVSFGESIMLVLHELARLQHLRSPVTVSDGEVDFAKHIAAAIRAATEGGAACGWTPCSGCYETEDGYPVGTYPHSKMFGCDVGGGCDECGGLGVTWQYWSTKDLEEMAREPALTAALAPAEQEGSAAPTHPGGDSRQVAELVQRLRAHRKMISYGVDAVEVESAPPALDLEAATRLENLLSALTAVERERDLYASGCEYLGSMFTKTKARAESAEADLAAMTDERNAALQAVDAFADICDELGVERDNEAGLLAAAKMKASLAAARELEAACDALAATRSQATYLSMIDNDYATDALARLDTARTNLRAALAGSNGE